MNRKLHLRKETLVELTGDELRGVVGATHIACGEPTHGGTSCDRCLTVPINDCIPPHTAIIETLEHVVATGGC